MSTNFREAKSTLADFTGFMAREGNTSQQLVRTSAFRVGHCLAPSYADLVWCLDLAVDRCGDDPRTSDGLEYQHGVGRIPRW